MSGTWRHRRRRFRNWFVGLIGPLILKIWVGSLRLRWYGPGLVRPSPEGREKVIYVFWHQRLLPFAVTHRNQGVRAVISAHGDGEMLARVAVGLGHKAIRGSSTRGGTGAARGLLSELGSGRDFVITPDGPRGPRFVFQAGATWFASRSGLAVIPASISYGRCWSLGSWDGFLLPRPFTRGLVLTGPPIRVPPEIEGESLEEWRRKLETALREVTEEGDRRFEELYRKGLDTKKFQNYTSKEQEAGGTSERTDGPPSSSLRPQA